MPLLDIADLSAGYGDIPILHGVSLQVEEAEVVSLVGANGAGKTTLLRALSGMLPHGGAIGFAGRAISGLAPDAIVELGLAHVPEGRQLFAGMTVEENLALGLPRRCARVEARRRLDEIMTLFPRLGERRSQAAGTLSGGEQQMVAIGRGLALGPRLLVLDEPSLGLAPAMVQFIFETVTALNRRGMAVLLVEQNVVESLRRSHRAYVLETGRVVLAGAAQALLQDERTRAAFLGGASQPSEPREAVS